MRTMCGTVTESHQPPRSSHPLRPMGFIALVFGAVLVMTLVSRHSSGREIVPWQSDLAAARTHARESNKPVLLYFTAEWCGPCQFMRKTTWTDRQVADALKEYIPVRIDIDQQPSVARQYGVEAIPRFVILSPQGEVTRSAVGAKEPQEFINWLND